MGTLREQPARALLLAHRCRPATAQGRRVRLASLRDRGVQGAGARMTGPVKRFFRLPWRTTRQIRHDVDEELGFHLDMRVQSLVAEGLAPDAARRQALREFGDLEDARRYMGAVDRDIEAAQRRSD